MFTKNKSWVALVVVAVFVSFSAVFAQNSVEKGTSFPVIVTHPQSITLDADEVYTLSVEAIASDGGTLAYQWWVGITEDKTVSRPLFGSTEKSLSMSGIMRDTVYFFVVVTNTKASVGSAKVESNLARVVKVRRINATAPTITVNPKNTSVRLGIGTTLLVSATVSDGGKLNYQWLRNTDINDTTGWAIIEGATKETYNPDVSKAGTLYYRAIATNTNAAVNGKQTASQTSNAATVAVANEGKVNATFPVLSGPNTVVLEKYNDPTALSVSAESLDGGTLSYQWFRTPLESNIGGEAIEGANSATFDPGRRNSPLAFYYYVEVTNTNAKVSGEPKALTKSSAVQVLEGIGEITAVKTIDRVIPQTNTVSETAVITPVSKLATELTVGPNPASRSSGGVAFFRQGTLIVSASLTVYNAAGNAVQVLSIRDNAAGSQSKRRVGSWDLKDASGRLVPDGMYLVKGTIAATGGKSQNVSLLVSVR